MAPSYIFFHRRNPGGLHFHGRNDMLIAAAAEIRGAPECAIMKILLYNIAYGTGNPGSEYRRLFSGYHYLRAPERPSRKIRGFLAAEKPDAVCLVETDLGSRRFQYVNQVEHLAEELGYHCFFQQKYGPDSVFSRLPYLQHQGNAILTRARHEMCDVAFFPVGMKRLILSAQVDGITLVVVHLALTRKTRLRQLRYLAEILPETGPLVVAGDFNTFAGEGELHSFLRKTQLRSANVNILPTSPAWTPARQLEYLLLSPELKLSDFHVPKVRFSDHLPLVAEIDFVKGSA